MFPNLEFIRMFHIGRDSLVDSVLTNNISRKGNMHEWCYIFFLCSTYLQQTCLRNVKFNLSKFYDYAAKIIRSRANCFSTRFSLR